MFKKYSVKHSRNNNFSNSQIGPPNGAAKTLQSWRLRFHIIWQISNFLQKESPKKFHFAVIKDILQIYVLFKRIILDNFASFKNNPGTLSKTKMNFTIFAIHKTPLVGCEIVKRNFPKIKTPPKGEYFLGRFDFY